MPNSSTGSTQIDALARAIWGDCANALQFEQARVIAESELMLLRVRAARIAAIERSKVTPPSEQIVVSAAEAVQRGDLREATKIIERVTRAMQAALKAPEADDNDHNVIKNKSTSYSAVAEQSMVQPQADVETPSPQHQHEIVTLPNWLPEWIRLDRYERRALSRRRRAIRNFVAFSIFPNS
jgi:hypothetical protein